MSEINKTLENRKKSHGDFRDNSNISQRIKNIIYDKSKTRVLSNSQYEALDMIAHKISRILAGDANFSDHWHDISGYAMLIEKQLKEDKKTEEIIYKRTCEDLVEYFPSYEEAASDCCINCIIERIPT